MIEGQVRALAAGEEARSPKWYPAASEQLNR